MGARHHVIMFHSRVQNQAVWSPKFKKSQLPFLSFIFPSSSASELCLELERVQSFNRFLSRKTNSSDKQLALLASKKYIYITSGINIRDLFCRETLEIV
jgi:hypothetical protein